MVKIYKYRHGLAVMRAQPFHLGHKRIVDMMLDKCEQVTIALGSIQEFGTNKNPLSYETRLKMIENVYASTKDFSRVNIIGLFDINSPIDWAEYVLDFIRNNNSELPKVDAYFSGSKEDASWYINAIENVEIVDRLDINFPFVVGTTVRDMIRGKDGSWKKLISLENHKLIEDVFYGSLNISLIDDEKALWKKLKLSFGEFCKESGFSKVALGLSGGLDSAIVAVLAAEVLGGNNVYAYMMKTKYTSQESLDIAKEVSILNNLNYKVLDIQNRVDSSYSYFKDVFEVEPEDIVMQNIQARARGDILMSISNQFRYLILACSNKSEISMGYCTLYGDVCGAFAPIGKIYKSKIFSLANWLNLEKARLPERVISRVPSAELAEGQKDEDSLLPYSALDKILELYIDSDKRIEDIVAMGYSFEDVSFVVKRYHSMAFKRIQMPPALEL